MLQFETLEVQVDPNFKRNKHLKLERVFLIRGARKQEDNYGAEARKLRIPGMTQSRLLPTVLLAASSWLLISLFGSQQSLSIELGKIASSNSGVETIANNEVYCY